MSPSPLRRFLERKKKKRGGGYESSISPGSRSPHPRELNGDGSAGVEPPPRFHPTTGLRAEEGGCANEGKGRGIARAGRSERKGTTGGLAKWKPGPNHRSQLRWVTSPLPPAFHPFLSQKMPWPNHQEPRPFPWDLGEKRVKYLG